MWFNLHIFYDADTASSAPDATPSETLEDPYEETIPNTGDTGAESSRRSDDSDSSDPAPPPPPRLVPDYTFDNIGTAENVIGIRDPELYHGATDNISTGSRVNLTTAIFDTTSRADSARIWLKNELGYDVYVRGVSIRGKLVYKNSPPKSGIVHDQYKDHDSIRESGERRFTIKNDYVVNWDQARKLADYYWKFFGGDDPTKAKHIYTLRLHGVYAWFEVGNRYRVTIGGAGQAENIDSHCELQSVSSVINSKGIGRTTLVLRQMELLWTDTSSANLRTFAYGRRAQYSTNNGTVLVAPSTAFVTADYYCDGTADNVQIQLAIDYLSTTFGGGVVNLLSGTYNLTTALTLRSGVVLMGQGKENTKLRLGLDEGITSTSTVDASVRELTIDATYTRASTPSNNTWTYNSTTDTRLTLHNVKINNSNGGCVKVSGATEFWMHGCVLVDAQRAVIAEAWSGGYTATSPASYISMDDNNSFLVENNEIYSTSAPATSNTGGQGFNVIYAVASTGGRIRNNYIHDMIYTTLNTSGENVNVIWVQGYPEFSPTYVNEQNDVGTVIENNNIIDSYCTNGTFHGIRSESNNLKISGNVLTNLSGRYNNEGSSPTIGMISIKHDNNVVSNNTFTNCTATFVTISTADRTLFEGNQTLKSGQLLTSSRCEETQAPTIDGTSATSNATYAKDTAQKYTGLASFKITSSGSGVAYAYFHDNAGATGDLHGLYVGRKYTCSAWVYIPSGVGITGTNFGITFQDYQGSWGWTTGSATNTYGSWQFITVTRTIRSSATAVNIYFAWSASGSGEYLYVDDLRFYPDNIFNDHSTLLNDNGTNTIT